MRKKGKENKGEMNDNKGQIAVACKIMEEIQPKHEKRNSVQVEISSTLNMVPI